MASTIKTNKNDLVSVINGESKVHGAPYIGIGVGTAQVNKLLNVAERFGDVGQEDRFQSVWFEDINQDTLDRIRGLESSIGWMNSRDMQVFTPSFIPTDTGFNRDPLAYRESAGGLVEDYVSIIRQMKSRSEELESQPQMIMMFMGFGSHALLGWDIYKRVRKAFPKSLILVVLSVPDEQMIRRQASSIWDEYRKNIEDCDNKTVFLLVDDSKADGDLKANDHKLAVLLASIEQANATDAASGTLVDVISALKSYAGGTWLGVNVAPPILLPSKRRFSFVPPFVRYGTVDGKTKDLERLVSDAAADASNPDWQLADHRAPLYESERKTFVSLPHEKADVNERKKTISRWIKEKMNYGDAGYAKPDFAAGNFAAAPSEEYLASRPPKASPIWLRLLGLPFFPVLLMSDAIKALVFERKRRFFSHIGQIYAIEEAWDGFETIPSLKNLSNVSTGPTRKNGNIRTETDPGYGSEEFAPVVIHESPEFVVPQVHAFKNGAAAAYRE
jgi:hypothetical protein